MLQQSCTFAEVFAYGEAMERGFNHHKHAPVQCTKIPKITVLDMDDTLRSFNADWLSPDRQRSVRKVHLTREKSEKISTIEKKYRMKSMDSGYSKHFFIIFNTV